MSDHHAAEIAAKALAVKLKIPSWIGSVSVWRDGEQYSLRVFVNKSWFNQHQTEIPKEFQGFIVVVDDQLHGIALSKFRMSKYA